MSRYFDRNGMPISSDEWCLRLRPEEQRVALDKLEGSEVSTVWLGLDHQFYPGGPPLIFETMVFGGPLDEEMDRYSTLEQAVKGHADMVAKVRVALAEAKALGKA